jgi:hypothetical protein
MTEGEGRDKRAHSTQLGNAALIHTRPNKMVLMRTTSVTTSRHQFLVLPMGIPSLRSSYHPPNILRHQGHAVMALGWMCGHIALSGIKVPAKGLAAGRKGEKWTQQE